MFAEQGRSHGTLVARRGPARVLVLLAGLASLLFPALLQAQAADSVIPLAPIEVTVLRTPLLENASPFAVSVITVGELHQGRSGAFLEEALQGLPGVQVQNRFNLAVGERVAIRGFGARAQFGLRGIRVLVDGIPATLPDGQSSLDHLDIGSMGRVEALRGPASALFGNASGGVLSFTTRDAAAGPFDLQVEGVGGSNGLRRGQVTASGTVNGTQYLVTGSSQTWDGYRIVNPASPRFDTLESYGGSDRLGLNARVVTPAAGGELSFTANVLDLDAESPGSTPNDFRDSTSFVIVDTYLRFRTGKTIQQQQGGVRWVGPVAGLDGDFSLYGVHRKLNNPIPFDVIDLERKGLGMRAQLGQGRPAGSGEFRWLTGVDVDLQNDDRKENALVFLTGQPAPGVGPFLDQKEKVRGVGVFGQGSFVLDGGAVILAGLRYDNHHFEAEDRVPTSINADDSGTRSMSAFSPSVGASVPLGESAHLFGSVSSVFETPTTTELSNQPDAPGGFNEDLDPMKGTSVEAGFRGEAGGVATFEVSAYQTNLTNELVPFEVPGQAGVTFFRNSGESRHRGVEASVSLADRAGIVRGDLSYTFTDARFQEYLVRLQGGATVDVGQNCAALEDPSKGCRVPGVAPQRLQGLLRVAPGVVFGQVVGTYVDKVAVNDVNTASAPSYFLVDVRAGLDDFVVGNVTLSPWAAVTNLTDEAYIASVVVNATGNRFFEPGPERSFQVGMRAAWAR